MRRNKTLSRAAFLAACKAHGRGFSEADLTGPSRAKPLLVARMVIASALSSQGHSDEQIGAHLKRAHSVIRYYRDPVYRARMKRKANNRGERTDAVRKAERDRYAARPEPRRQWATMTEAQKEKRRATARARYAATRK